MVNRDLQGIVGELGVCKAFNRLAKKYHTRYVHNVPIKGVTSLQQIDAVLVTPFGYYAIEVKNWLGIISCSPKDYYWTVTYDKRDLYTKSPIIQNAQHCRYLARNFKKTFESLIIFPDNVVLSNPVEYTIQVTDIEKFFVGKERIYTDEQVDATYKQIVALKQELEIMSIADSIYREGERLS